MGTDSIDLKARMVVCRECEKFNKHLAQCKVCKCFMPVKTKIKSSKCPLGKW
jgi:hypothetical protein